MIKSIRIRQTRFRLAIPLFLLLCAKLPAQNVTGSLTGSVRDSSDRAIAGASITLSNEATRSTITLAADDQGSFVFNALLPGQYSLGVTSSGFSRLEQTGIAITAGDRRSAGTLVLQIGALSETVSVTAPPADVQTVSSERSGLITKRQVTDLMLIGRD